MTIAMRCPWESPPLRSNTRMHWAPRARLISAIRSDAGLVTRQYLQTRARTYQTQGIPDPTPPPITWPVTVTMTWEVTDHHVRDAGSMTPTLKAWIDGMVDGGLIHSDRHEIVTDEHPHIEYGTRKGVRVEITETGCRMTERKTPWNHTPNKVWEIYREAPGEWVVQWNCKVGRNGPLECCGSVSRSTWGEAVDVLQRWATQKPAPK